MRRLQCRTCWTMTYVHIVTHFMFILLSCPVRLSALITRDVTDKFFCKHFFLAWGEKSLLDITGILNLDREMFFFKLRLLFIFPVRAWFQVVHVITRWRYSPVRPHWAVRRPLALDNPHPQQFSLRKKIPKCQLSDSPWAACLKTIAI